MVRTKKTVEREWHMPTIFDFDVSDLPTNRKIIQTEGVTHKDSKKLLFNEIFLCNTPMLIKNNSARQGDEDGKHIQDLRYSMKDGVDVNCPPPSVEIIDPVEIDGVWKKYRLLDGHHRVAAICGIRDDNEDLCKEYVFDVYEIEKISHEQYKTTFQLKANAHPAAKKSMDADIVSAGVKLYEQGVFGISPDKVSEMEQSIMEWIEEVKGGAVGTQKNKTLLRRILNKTDVELPFVVYDDRSDQRWVNKYVPEVILDKDGGDYWIMKKGCDRAFMRMLKKATKKIQKIILNPEPSSAGNVKSTRQNLMNYIQEMWEKCCEKTGGDPKINKVFEIVFALPQLRDGSEDLTKPVYLK